MPFDNKELSMYRKRFNNIFESYKTGTLDDIIFLQALEDIIEEMRVAYRIR